MLQLSGHKVYTQPQNFVFLVWVQLGQGGLACNKSKGTPMSDSKEFTNLSEREKLGPGSNVRTECWSSSGILKEMTKR